MRPGTPPHGAWWGGLHGLLFHYFFYHFTAGKRGSSEGGHYWSGKRGWSWDEITKTPFFMGAGTIEIITGGEWNYKKYFTGHSKRIPRSGHDHANLVNLCCIGEIFKMGPICDTCMAVPFSGLSEQSFTVCVALNEGWNYFPNHPQLFFFFYFLNKMRYSWEINNYSKI